MQPTILIIEDHEAVRRSLCEWVQVTFPWSRVIEADSGEAALGLAETLSPAIVIMDIGLPGMNGIEATHRLTATVPAVRVVMLTILEGEAYRADAAAAGACAYVPKRRMHTDLIPVLAALLADQGGAKRANA